MILNGKAVKPMTGANPEASLLMRLTKYYYTTWKHDDPAASPIINDFFPLEQAIC